MLLAQLHRRIHQLIEVADHLASGTRPAGLVRALRLKPFQAEKLAGQARRWSLVELTAALDGLLDLDSLVKGVAGTTATDAQRRMAFSLWIWERVAAGSVATAAVPEGARP